ncbi:MAG: polysaccharide biosynthesis tyrosine autokinase [Clostridia bacterium]|nr:polysaccharide biosynthesis tyrosine autokinase [Clostridia bacterium]
MKLTTPLHSTEQGESIGTQISGNFLEINSLEEQDYARREALNSLRTNLQFCGDDKKVIMLTSCTPNEGKSTITLELARSFCEAGKRVILLDADLRKSVLVGRHHMVAKGGAIKGLSHLLSGQAELADVLYQTNVEGLYMILTGPVAPNPTELLGKEYFQSLIKILREYFDIVLLDCPPLGSVIDAAVIAPNCDGSVLVVESRAISYRFLQDVKKQLEITGCPILGVVLNKVKVEKGGRYGGYYGKYGKYGKYEKYEKYGE